MTPAKSLPAWHRFARRCDGRLLRSPRFLLEADQFLKAGSHTLMHNDPCGVSSQGQAGMPVASHILGSSWDTIIRLCYEKQDHSRDV